MADDAAERRLRHQILIIAHRVRTDAFYSPQMICNDLAEVAKPPEPPPLSIAALPLFCGIVAGLFFNFAISTAMMMMIWVMFLGLGLVFSILILLYLLAVRWDCRKEKRISESLLNHGRSNGNARMFLWSAIRDRARSGRLRD